KFLLLVLINKKMSKLISILSSQRHKNDSKKDLVLGIYYFQNNKGDSINPSYLQYRRQCNEQILARRIEDGKDNKFHRREFKDLKDMLEIKEEDILSSGKDYVLRKYIFEDLPTILDYFFQNTDYESDFP
ncbi:MAG: hypothetical protein KC589_01455, partial [Nanoarchaeota archaeon]|nr:hypothetical protein [Nanoarchaeota archaeon]